MATNRSKSRKVAVNVNLTDTQTPASCSRLISEIIKYILCQKQQIPYPYEYLEHIVKREREVTGKILASQFSRCSSVKLQPETSENTTKGKAHCRKAVEAFEALENIFQHIDAEVRRSNSGDVEEIMVLLGATPVSPKEVYRILLPPVSNIIGNEKGSRRSLLQILRSIIMSEDLHALISQPIAPTNAYILLKKTTGGKCDWFLPKDQYCVPNRGHHAVFHLNALRTKQDVNTIVDPKTLLSNGHESSLHLSSRNNETCFTIYQENSDVIHLEKVLIANPMVTASDDEGMNIQQPTKVVYQEHNVISLHSSYLTSTTVPSSENNIDLSSSKKDVMYSDVEKSAMDTSEDKYSKFNHKSCGSKLQHANKSYRTVNKIQWYQAQVKVKGYRYCVSKKTETSDMLSDL